MKTTLTIEQSAELIRLGVPKERASKQVMRQTTDSHGRPLQDAELKKWSKCRPFEKQDAMQNVGFTKYEFKNIFTIADLLSMLPCTIEIDGEVYDLILSYSRFQYWRAYYSLRMNVLYNAEKELIDALWGLLADLIEGNYVKPKEL